MQISGVSLTLTWPCRFVYSEFSCAPAPATSFPLSKHTGGGDTAPAFSGLRVCLQFTWEVGLPPSPVEFSSHCRFYKLSLLIAGCVLLFLPEPLWPGLACLFTVPGRSPLPPLRHSRRPTLFATCLYCSYCLLLLSFSFFPGRRSVCPGGYADLA
jgi:hypothetical protein